MIPSTARTTAFLTMMLKTQFPLDAGSSQLTNINSTRLHIAVLRCKHTQLLDREDKQLVRQIQLHAQLSLYTIDASARLTEDPSA